MTCRWSLSRRVSIRRISCSAREMRVAKRFITLCRARIFLVCARYSVLGLLQLVLAVLQLVLGLLEHVLVGRGEPRKTDRRNGCKHENRGHAGHDPTHARCACLDDARGLDIWAGSSLPFIRGRSRVRSCHRPIGRPRRGLKSHDEQLSGRQGGEPGFCVWATRWMGQRACGEISAVVRAACRRIEGRLFYFPGTDPVAALRISFSAAQPARRLPTVDARCVRSSRCGSPRRVRRIPRLAPPVGDDHVDLARVVVG